MYGSQTGNAQSIAEGVHDGCQKRGLESTLLKCDAWKKGFDLICRQVLPQTSMPTRAGG
ncbi:unnamed protein product, partial [Ectocarpus sp. 12 AP-2014]